MNSIANNTQSAYKLEVSQAITEQKPIIKPIPEQNQEVFQNEEEIVNKAEREPETTEGKIRKSFFDKYVDKIKDFLDNAE
jgi:cell division protein FtsA